MARNTRYKEVIMKLYELLQFVRDETNRKEKRVSSFTQLCGEFHVMNALLMQGKEPSYKSGQCGYDIALNNKKIEVKSAMYNEKENCWGFGGIKPKKFHILVCVALQEKFTEKPNFYIFTSEEASFIPKESETRNKPSKRYTNDKKTIHIFKDRESPKDKNGNLVYTKRVIELNKKILDYKNKWEKIKR